MSEKSRASFVPESLGPERWDEILEFSRKLIDKNPNSWWVKNNKGVSRVIDWFAGAKSSTQAFVHVDNIVPITHYLIDYEGFAPVSRMFYGYGDIKDIDPNNPRSWLRIERFYPIFEKKNQHAVVSRVDPYFMSTVRNGNDTAERFCYGPNLYLQHQSTPEESVPLPEITDPYERLAQFFSI